MNLGRLRFAGAATPSALCLLFAACCTGPRRYVAAARSVPAASVLAFEVYGDSQMGDLTGAIPTEGGTQPAAGFREPGPVPG